MITLEQLDEQAAGALGKLEILVSSGKHDPGEVLRSALASICGAIARADRIGSRPPDDGQELAVGDS